MNQIRIKFPVAKFANISVRAFGQPTQTEYFMASS